MTETTWQLLLGGGFSPEPDGLQMPPPYPGVRLMEHPASCMLHSAVTNAGALIWFFCLGNQHTPLGSTGGVCKAACARGTSSQASGGFQKVWV